jgi:hypothetical protein
VTSATSAISGDNLSLGLLLATCRGAAWLLGVDGNNGQARLPIPIAGSHVPAALKLTHPPL